MARATAQNPPMLPSLSRTLWALLFPLLLLAAGIWAFADQARQHKIDQANQERALHQARATASLLQSVRAKGGNELDLAPALNQALVADGRTGDRYRLVMREGKRLLASTLPEDGPSDAFPRSLSVAEKPLYDVLLTLPEAGLVTGQAKGETRAAVPIDDTSARAGYVEIVRLDTELSEAGGAMGLREGGTLLVIAVLGLMLARLRPQALGWIATATPLLVAYAGIVLLGGTEAGLQNSIWLLGVCGALLAAFIGFGGAASVGRAYKDNPTAYHYVGPAIIGMLALAFFPFFYGVTLSFTDTTLLNQGKSWGERWVGLTNYLSILNDFNFGEPGKAFNYQNFYWTLGVTIVWTITNVWLGVSIGLGLALLLNTKGLKGVAIYRTLLILPWAIPNYITALTWKGMFHPQFGAINQIISAFGGTPVQWFDSFGPSFITGLATNAWLSFPFMMVVALGALQSVDEDMYEAARIDGASPWQQFWHITLPSLRPALLPAIIVSVVWTFNMFNVIYLVSAGQPSGSTEILVTRAYKIAFEEYRYGYAAAYSVVIFMILLVYGVFQIKATAATEANNS